MTFNKEARRKKSVEEELLERIEKEVKSEFKGEIRIQDQIISHVRLIVTSITNYVFSADRDYLDNMPFQDETGVDRKAVLKICRAYKDILETTEKAERKIDKKYHINEDVIEEKMRYELGIIDEDIETPEIEKEFMYNSTTNNSEPDITPSMEARMRLVGELEGRDPEYVTRLHDVANRVIRKVKINKTQE